tara:strand:+ start:680 stop:1216 length:537 start_codon:yes stop_codon:yes gene_type:complete
MEKIILLESDSINKTISRLSHEIIEKNPAGKFSIIGIRNRGDVIARKIKSKIEQTINKTIEFGTIDVTFHRDDYKQHLPSPKIGTTEILFEIEGKTLILVDDVLFTGRTIRSAMDEVFSFGRPSSIQLVVLVDRGHREIPIKASFVGKNYPTSKNEHIHVNVKEIDGEDSIVLRRYKK